MHDSMPSVIALVALACAAGACAHGATPPVAAPLPAVAARAAPADSSVLLAGRWAYTVAVGEEGYRGTMDLAQDTGGWHAMLQDETLGEVRVTSLTVQGALVTMDVVGPTSPVKMSLRLQPDGSLSGTMDVNAGEVRGSFSATRK